MDATVDELAGVLDLFGGLTREELESALAEVAFRADGQSLRTEVLEGAIEDAIESFGVVPVEVDAENGTELLVPGPTALPTVPEHGEDLPHIMDVEARRVDRETVAVVATERFREAVSTAVEDESAERCRRLLDASYDLEAWASVELEAERARLDEVIE